MENKLQEIKKSIAELKDMDPCKKCKSCPQNTWCKEKKEWYNIIKEVHI